MSIHYRNYIWKEGIPYGVEQSEPQGITYKIPSDPYHKQISIEQYEDSRFCKVVYDSRLLDFRQLKPENQLAWEKTKINEALAEIRNQDDRLLYVEEYFFDGNLCRQCRVSSAHGILLSVHRMYYRALGDSFDGVILFDSNEHKVMVKTYEVDEETGLYTRLLKEEWNYALFQDACSR